ncbi:DNA helicase, partial [Vibrio anguillarum]|nr:DNA helicase [Vibrio anguillarum]
SVLPDSMSGLTKMLSGLRRQEAIFVGQAATLPTRVMIRSLSDDQLPRSNDVNFDKGWQQQAMTIEQIGAVVTKWRYQSK